MTHLAPIPYIALAITVLLTFADIHERNANAAILRAQASSPAQHLDVPAAFRIKDVKWNGYMKALPVKELRK